MLILLAPICLDFRIIASSPRDSACFDMEYFFNMSEPSHKNIIKNNLTYETLSSYQREFPFSQGLGTGLFPSRIGETLFAAPLARRRVAFATLATKYDVN